MVITCEPGLCCNTADFPGLKVCRQQSRKVLLVARKISVWPAPGSGPWLSNLHEAASVGPRQSARAAAVLLRVRGLCTECLSGVCRAGQIAGNGRVCRHFRHRHSATNGRTHEKYQHQQEKHLCTLAGIGIVASAGCKRSVASVNRDGAGARAVANASSQKANRQKPSSQKPAPAQTGDSRGKSCGQR